MEKTLEKLAATLPELPPHLRRAARRILDHPHEVAVLSMRTLAAKAQVNPPTMLRLVRRIGFADYETFRGLFRNAVAGGRFRDKAASLQEMHNRAGKAGVVGGMVDAANEYSPAPFPNPTPRRWRKRHSSCGRRRRSTSSAPARCIGWACTSSISAAPCCRSSACRAPISIR